MNFNPWSNKVMANFERRRAKNGAPGDSSRSCRRLALRSAGRDGALRRPRPRPAGGPNVVGHNVAHVRSVAWCWRSATGSGPAGRPCQKYQRPELPQKIGVHPGPRVFKLLLWNTKP
jgi:hypothetical protein